MQTAKAYRAVFVPDSGFTNGVTRIFLNCRADVKSLKEPLNYAELP